MPEASRTDGGWRCVLVVGGAYLVQGLIAAIGVLIVGLLAQLDAPLEDQVGFLASGAVPWVLKVAVAVLLDLGPSWSYRVRAALIGALQIAAAVCVWGLAMAWSTGAGAELSMLTLAVGWVALNTCAATQDVLVDALALDTLSTRRPAAAAAMGVGLALGFGLLDPFVIRPRIIADGVTAGLMLPAWWIAGLALATAALLWQPGRPVKARTQAEARARDPSDRPRLIWVPIVLFAATFANNSSGAVMSEFLFNTLDWDLVSYGVWIMPVAAIAGLVGAFAWGPVIARLGPARAALIASAGLGLVWLLFASASPWWSQRALFVLMAGSEGVLQAGMMVGLHALALLAASRSPMPTTVFVLAMAALNLPRVIAPLLAPQALALGWIGLFAACGVTQIVVSAGLWPLRSWGADRRETDVGLSANAVSPDVDPGHIT